MYRDIKFSKQELKTIGLALYLYRCECEKKVDLCIRPIHYYAKSLEASELLGRIEDYLREK